MNASYQASLVNRRIRRFTDTIARRSFVFRAVSSWNTSRSAEAARVGGAVIGRCRDRSSSRLICDVFHYDALILILLLPSAFYFSLSLPVCLQLIRCVCRCACVCLCINRYE